MKTSFLKGFFNSKDYSKSHFNIHNVDLDDSDGVALRQENIFQRNNSPKEHNTKSNDSKSDDIFHKKFNIYSLNESISSINSDLKSPVSNEFNHSKLKSMYLNNNNEKIVKSKSSLPFTTPNPVNILKTPIKESKLSQFDTSNKNYLNKELSSPTVLSKGFINRNYETNKSLKCENIKKSPVPWKVQFSPKKLIGNDVKRQLESDIKNNSIDICEDDFFNEKNLDSENINDMNLENYEESADISKYTQDSFEKINNVMSEKSTEFDDLPFNDITSYSENSQLKVLHMKLKMEVDKIHKWKENLEKQLLFKNQKLKESDKIIESLRASNLDFQMQQENISLNYQMELDCRSEVSKKIENSRNLCQILKQKIENIDKINKNHLKEANNLKAIQSKTLATTGNILEDIKCYSETQLICIDSINKRIFSKDEEIKSLKDSISSLQHQNEKETIAFNSERERFQNRLLVETEKFNVLIEENNNNILLKVQNENLFVEEQNKSQKLKNEIVKRLDEIFNLETSKKLCEENNHNLLEEIEIKNNEVTNLKEMLTNLEITHLKFKESVSLEMDSLNNLSKINAVLNEDLKAINLKNSEEIEYLNRTIDNMKDEFDSKMQIKDNSIGNLTNSILEKENNISNLEDKNKSNIQLLNDFENEISTLKLENEILSKNNTILKSSNSDLREEMENQILELKKLANNLSENKIQIDNFNEIIKTLTEKNKDYKEIAQKLNEEKQTINEEFNAIQIKLNDIQNKNKELEISIINSNALEKNITQEKDSVIKGLQKKLNILQNNNNEMEKNINYIENEKQIFKNNLSTLSEENEVLSKAIEELKVLLISKDKDLLMKISEKNELEKQQKIDLEKIKNYEKNVFDLENLLSENKFKISSLETFVDDLSKEKHNILKSREDLRKELMFTLEQCKNEHEIIEKKKNREIENLKTVVNSLSLDSQNITNKSKTKLIEITTKLNKQKEEIETLENDLQIATIEKDQTKKLLDNATYSIKDLSEKLVNMENVVEELENSKRILKEQAMKFDDKVAIIFKEIEEKNSLISRLNMIETEYINLKNKLITNSPPMSTQIPEYIQLSSLATPKSQRLSTKLESFNEFISSNSHVTIEKQTPQKTPKGILRQPGSASKRRKVIFNENELIQTKLNVSDVESIHSDGVDIDLENISCINKESKSVPDNAKDNIIVTTTPKKPSLASKLNLTDSKNIGKLTNVRKTPSKASSKLNDKRKKDKENWFDSDNFFGVRLEA